MSARLTSAMIASGAADREKRQMLRQMVADAESAKKLQPLSRIERLFYLLLIVIVTAFACGVAVALRMVLA